MIFFTSRGGRSNEGTVQIDGMNVGSAFNGGGVAGYGYDTSGAQEVQLTVAGGLGEADRGGPHSTSFRRPVATRSAAPSSATSRASGRRATTWTMSCSSFGIPTAAAIIRSWDTSFSMGGPIMRDKVWFYGMARTFGAYTDIAGRFANANAGDPDSLGLRLRSGRHAAVGNEPQDRRRARHGSADAEEQGERLLSTIRRSAKAAPTRRTPISAGRAATTGSAWEASAPGRRRRRTRATTPRRSCSSLHLDGDQQAAARSGVLAVLQQLGRPDSGRRARSGAVHPGDVTEHRHVIGHGVQTGVPVTTMVYHGFGGLNNNHQTHNVWRGAVSYVTGAHSLKVGYQAAYEVTDIFGNYASHGLQYRFGTPQRERGWCRT